MQEIIDIYGESTLRNILLNYNELEKIYNYATVSKKGENNINCEYQNIQKAIDSYIAMLVITGEIKNDEILDNYKKVFNKTNREDFTYIFSSNLLKLPMERLEVIMSKDFYKAIDDRKEKIASKCFNTYKKVIDKKDLLNSEKIELINYLRSNIGTKDMLVFSMQEEVMKKIIAGDFLNDYEVVDFFTSFIAREEAKKGEYVGLCHLGEYEVNNKKMKDDKLSSSNGIRAVINKKFGINAIYQKGEELVDFIYTICYEMKHIERNFDIKRGVCNLDTINCLCDKIFQRYLSKNEYDSYLKNYFFESSEFFLEMSGYANALTYLKKYSNESTKDIENILLNIKTKKMMKKIIEIKDLTDNNKEDFDFYRYEKMKKIIKKQPDLVREYKQLQVLYEKDGNIKSFQKLLVEQVDFKKKNNKDNVNIYNSFFNYMIDNDGLNTIDFSNMNKEEIYKIMHSLSNLYNLYASGNYNNFNNNGNDRFLIDVYNSTKAFNDDLKNIRKRTKKIEVILDAMYNKFGEDYSNNESYSGDLHLYSRNKNYMEYKFNKIEEIDIKKKV